MSTSTVAELVDLMALERLEENLFRGQSRDIGTKYVFGGQVLGQALSAAQQTVADGRVAHSMHACFLRAADVKIDLLRSHGRTTAARYSPLMMRRMGRSFTANQTRA